MPPIVVDVSTKTLLVAALVVTLGALTVFGGVLVSMSGSQPEILEGDFTVQTPENALLAWTGYSCSTDADCPETQCSGTDYYVDQDGGGECLYNERQGEYQCGGYDKIYADAEYCGGSSPYNCDSTGCEGFKAACEDDCDASRGCDTYDFCSSDDDSSSSSGSDTSSCTDACQSLTKKCSGGNVVQCQDTDSDSCTDGFVTIESCDGECSNAACVVTDTDEETAEETTPGDGTDTDTDTDSQTLDERIAEVWTGVWTTLFGWM